MDEDQTDAVSHYNEEDEQGIAAVLVGRRIVQAEMGTFEYPRSYGAPAEGRLVLDDGTTLFLTGNEGGCSCGAGDYPLERVAAFDNVITSAHVQCSPSGDDYYGTDQNGEGAYRIFVFAGAEAMGVAEFVGSDGNGYYGTGFSLAVVKP